MTTKLADEIQAEQDHGRRKYGKGIGDFEHDDAHDDDTWHTLIDDHNQRASLSAPMDRRQQLVKVAGLAVSAIEAFDRRIGTVLVVISCALAMSAHAGDDTRRSCDRRSDNKNYIIRRQQAYSVRGTPSLRLYIGGRKIDVYHDGSMFERDHRTR